MTTHAPAAAKPSFTPAPSPLLRRKCACGGTPGPTGECDACRRRRLQRKAKPGADAPGPVPTAVLDALATSGTPLPAATRAFMEPRFGRDFGDVRVHTDERAAESARSVDADAYAAGPHIVFDRGQYAPETPAGRQLLAHELAHVAQQGSAGSSTPTGIASSNGPEERDADAAADRVLSGEPARPAATTSVTVARQPAPARAPMPYRPAPVIPYRPAANDNARPNYGPTLPSPGTGPRWVPSPHDDSFEAALARVQIMDNIERKKMEAERPWVTLESGGAAPSFITEHGTRKVEWADPSGGGMVWAKTRLFHVIPAIEYEIGKATTEADIEQVFWRYVPESAGVTDLIGLGMTGRARLPAIRGPMVFIPDVPVGFEGADPKASRRLAAIEAAVARRAQAVPALATSRWVPNTRTSRRGGCRLMPIAARGDDPLSSLYCHAATGTPFSYEIRVMGPGGALTNRWAEIDALRGNTWYECKCGYEKLLTQHDSPWQVARAYAILGKMDAQVANHLHLAAECGLDYRYIVSSERVAEVLRDRWGGLVTVDVVPLDLCD